MARACDREIEGGRWDLREEKEERKELEEAAMRSWTTSTWPGKPACNKGSMAGKRVTTAPHLLHLGLQLVNRIPGLCVFFMGR